MSSDIYARPDPSKMLKYKRGDEKAEWQEQEVEIYESVDAVGGDDAELDSHEAGLHKQKHPADVHRRPFSAAVVCLGVLCFLMLTGIILLSIHHISVTSTKDQLQTSFNKLNISHMQLQGNHSGMALNNSRLLSSYEAVRKNHSQLQEEVKQLKGKIEGRRCPDGWRKFGCSCYFKSSQRKTWWGDSRKQCQKDGADLVVINSEEERKFVIELSKNDESWIGLSQQWKSSRQVWEWVDGSPLTQTFWTSGLRNEREESAICCDQQGKLTQRTNYDYDSKSWICEK
ncbi:CD209 antigen-like protein E [Chaetodon trifascialis]|uniref:CD209 antigen-like protein E n=1 Tax=Chaetodon trifascialis TaxID=109706 RepID=UPI003991E23A